MGEGAGEAPSPVNHLDQDGRTFTERFEVGQLSFNRNGNEIGYFYDYTDEEAAFTREHALGSNEYRPNESYNSLYDKRRNKRSINESYDGNDIVHPKFIRL